MRYIFTFPGIQGPMLFEFVNADALVGFASGFTHDGQLVQVVLDDTFMVLKAGRP